MRGIWYITNGLHSVLLRGGVIGLNHGGQRREVDNA